MYISCVLETQDVYDNRYLFGNNLAQMIQTYSKWWIESAGIDFAETIRY